MADEANLVEEEVQDGVHNYSSAREYVKPTDPEILERLERFQDRKLGLMMHWGPYSQLGLVESWALSDEDADWSRGGIDWDVDGETFKAQYRALNTTFNPVRFQPDRWAEYAKDGGFQYLLFTTKHHDGFCMWDTRYSDYRITAPDCPFHAHHYADICAHLFEAFRRKGLGVVAYFSKADWHTPTYWAPNMPRGTFMRRGPSYDPAQHPELWEQFVQFTHNQVLELVQRYGRLDGLWFDAGWVRPGRGQDIRIEEMIEKARRIQPWLLSADRTCGGPCENYVTPEQCVPDKPLGIPWESCVTMGHSFSFAYEDRYKTVRELIHLLCDIVAKGGNLALNVAPQPDGRLPRTAIERMKGMGEWLRANGEAIYATRVCAPYRVGEFAYTKNAEAAYAIHLRQEGDAARETLRIPFEGPCAKVTCVATGKELAFERNGGEIVVTAEAPQVSVADAYKLWK